MLLFQLLQSFFRSGKPRHGFLIRKQSIRMPFTRRVTGIYMRVTAQRTNTSYCRFETMSFFDSTKYLHPDSFCCVINDLRAVDGLAGIENLLRNRNRATIYCHLGKMLRLFRGLNTNIAIITPSSTRRPHRRPRRR